MRLLHVIGEIGARNELPGAKALGQVPQLHRVEDDCVEVGPLQVVARGVLAVAAVFPGVEGVVVAARISGHEPAAMGDHELEPRYLIERAFVNQVRQCDGAVQRVADHVVQVMGREPLAIGEPRGMHEDHRTQFLRCRKEGEELRVGEFVAVHMTRNLHPPHPELAHAAV